MTLKELVESVFSDVQEREGGEVYADCCFCDDDKNRLGINVETGVMHCFKCEERSGDRNSIVNSKRRTYNKIAEATSISDPFTLDEGEEDTTVEEKTEELKKNKSKIEIRLPEAYEPLWESVNDRIGKRALQYMQDRHVTIDQIKKHKIGFCAAGKYSYRIIFPVYYRRKLTGFVCRDFSGNAEIKYLNSEGEKGLYNLPPKSRRKRIAILVEGIYDVLAVERSVPVQYDKIGGLGSKLTSRQLKQLSTYNEVVIWAEPDRAGVEGTIKRAIQLKKKKVKVKVVVPLQDIETDTDPGAMESEEIWERIQKAKEYTSGIASLMRIRVAGISPIKVKKKICTKRK